MGDGFVGVTLLYDMPEGEINRSGVINSTGTSQWTSEPGSWYSPQKRAIRQAALWRNRAR